MMRSFLGRSFGIVGSGRAVRDRKAQPRALQPSVDGLEHRQLLTGGGGSVTLAGSAVTVLPNTALSQNTVLVQYQTVSGKSMLDVQLNGVDHDFALGSVTEVYFNGTGTSSNESFTNTTSTCTVAAGGAGNNLFVGGTGTDDFVGGSGTNTFDAGSGFDIMNGGTGTNIYNESATGSGIIFKHAPTDTINAPSGATGTYYVF